MHGLILGPDGKLYWSIADRGTDTNLFAKISNPIPGLTPELLADSGCIFRANPDGSDFEVIAWGLRNPQELAFDEFGNLFTADNNGDGGDKARWHYVVEGADFGWRIGWQWLEARAYQPKMGPWNGERLWHLAGSNTAAYLLPPLAHIGHGPAGLAYNPGTGLPPQFDRHFFLCDFPGHVLMWTNIPDGASFKVGPVKNFFGELGPSDIAFGVDGGVYVTDWFKSFDKSDKGRIYRIHDRATDANALVQETKWLLADHRPLRWYRWPFRIPLETVESSKRRVKSRSEMNLGLLLAHPDMRVRQMAQEELVDREIDCLMCGLRAGDGPLVENSRRGTNRLARLHALWGLQQLEALLEALLRPLGERRWPTSRPRPQSPIVELCSDAEEEIRAHAANAIGRTMNIFESKRLLPQLQDSSPRVRFFVAQSLGTLRIREAAPRLIELLRDNADRDLYLRHAAVVALARIADTNALLSAANDASRSVRLGVLLALRRLGRPEVARFLSDPDPQLVLEAARAINDVPIEAAFPQLAVLIDRANSKLETRNSELTFFTLRRALNANFRVGQATNAQALAAFAWRDDAPAPLRVEALELLSLWPKPPGRDHFMGLWRPLPPREAKPAGDALRPGLASLVGAAPKDVRLAALRAAAALDVNEADWFALVADATQPSEVRVEALTVLAGHRDPRLTDAIKTALADPGESLRIAAAKLSKAAGAASPFARMLESGTLGEKQGALASLATAKDAEADRLVGQQLDALLGGSLPQELALDVLEAAVKHPSLSEKLSTYEARLPKDNPLAAWRPVLQGGNADNGRKIFIENQQVACFRCHKVNGDGGEVGPELTGLGQRQSREYILESIVYPNKQIAADYENLIVTLKNGVTYAGQVKQATAKELQINSPEDGLVRIATADIKDRQRGLSAMPEELPTYLSRRELRDLVEFLATVR
jgi:quinoprotein glucose dehydrogenase